MALAEWNREGGPGAECAEPVAPPVYAGAVDDAIDDWTEIECPHCGERVEIYLDPETRGRLVQDCEVCCRPWQLEVARDRDGRLRVTVAGA